jgi:hypothetical protein
MLMLAVMVHGLVQPEEFSFSHWRSAAVSILLSTLGKGLGVEKEHAAAAAGPATKVSPANSIAVELTKTVARRNVECARSRDKNFDTSGLQTFY